MIILDVQDRRPIYEQLKTKITELVLMEVYPPQMQLPSVRSLARELGVNPNTVQKAYQELEREKVDKEEILQTVADSLSGGAGEEEAK